jgi:hypothetical protein
MNEFRGALFLPHTDPRLFPSVRIPEQTGRHSDDAGLACCSGAGLGEAEGVLNQAPPRRMTNKV